MAGGEERNRQLAESLARQQIQAGHDHPLASYLSPESTSRRVDAFGRMEPLRPRITTEVRLSLDHSKAVRSFESLSIKKALVNTFQREFRTNPPMILIANDDGISTSLAGLVIEINGGRIKEPMVGETFILTGEGVFVVMGITEIEEGGSYKLGEREVEDDIYYDHGMDFAEALEREIQVRNPQP